MPGKEHNERTPPWEQGQQVEPVSFGTWLRRQREVREVPLREIADVTKISLRYLEALEQDRFDVLPAPVFAKGFLREYSRYVGLDTDEVVNSFLTASGGEPEAPPEAEEPVIRESGASGGRKPMWMALAALVAVAAVAGLAFFLTRSREAGPPAQSPLTAPMPEREATRAEAPEPSDAAQDPAAAPLSVIIDFTADCWVEAVVDDVRRISELHVQGESMRLDAESRVVLTLGNPGGVRVEVNGEPYAFDHADGEVMRDLVIDVEPAGGAPQDES